MGRSSESAERLQLVRDLELRVAGLREATDKTWATASWISSGCPAWDRSLPRKQGFRRGSLVEWLVEEPGNGAGTLALLVARQACLSTGTLVVLDEACRFYPPAAAACGIDLQRLIVIRPQNPRDALWAWDQSLRCPAVKAVWGWLEPIGDRWFRRFQLAAEQSGCLGLLLRSPGVRGRPSWSELQLAVSACDAPPEEMAEGGGRLRVEVVRCRGSALLEQPAGFPSRSSPGLSSATRLTQELDHELEQGHKHERGLEHGRLEHGRERGGAPRNVMHLRLEERQGQLRVIAAREHETSALPLPSELAPPMFPRGASGA